MNLPEKEFLSKKKCVYEVICLPDGQFSVERRAIAYLNTDCTYVVVPGSSQLDMIWNYKIHDSNDTETILEASDFAIRHRVTRSRYFWDRPDISSANLKEVRKLYLQNQIKEFREKRNHVLKNYKLEYKTYSTTIENLTKELEEIQA